MIGPLSQTKEIPYKTLTDNLRRLIEGKDVHKPNVYATSKYSNISKKKTRKKTVKREMLENLKL